MNRFVRVALMVLVLAASQPFAMQARAESVPEELSSMVTELHDIYVHFKVRVFAWRGLPADLSACRGR